MDMQWEISSSFKIHEEDQNLVRQTLPIIGPKEEQRSTKWKDKLEEWQRDKRHEKHQKEILKKRNRQQKLAQKIQRHKEKHQQIMNLGTSNDNSIQKSNRANHLSLDVTPKPKGDTEPHLNSKQSSVGLEGATVVLPVARPPVHPVNAFPLTRPDDSGGNINIPIRRNVSDTCLANASLRSRRGNSERLLRERANVVSYLHHTANDTSNSACSTPIARASVSKTDVGSFLGRLSFDLEAFIDNLSSKADDDRKRPPKERESYS